MLSGSISMATGAWIWSPGENGCRSSSMGTTESVCVGDFHHDGRSDLVAGNLGLNYTYTTSRESRFGIYGADFTGNRITDVVLTQEINGTEYPLAGMAPLGTQMYQLALRFPTYGSFADASVGQLFSAAKLQQAIHYQTDTFASVYL